MLAGALMSVWLMFGLVDDADAQAAAPVQVAVAPNMSVSEPGASGLGALDATLEDRLQALAMAGARQVAPTQARVEIEIGKLDPRLRLAPCAQIQPYLPPGTRMWGRSRLGLRCVAGVTKWNVTLPLTIKVYGQAFVAAADLPTGTVLTQEHFRLAEVDIAGEAGAIYTQAEGWLGRHLAKPVAAGQALRSVDLKLRQGAAGRPGAGDGDRRRLRDRRRRPGDGRRAGRPGRPGTLRQWPHGHRTYDR